MQREEQSKLKSFKYYMQNSVYFYKIKSDVLAKISFIILLVCFTSVLYLPFNIEKIKLYFALFLIATGISLSFGLYTTSYIRELRGKDCSNKFCINRVKKKFGTIFLSTLLLYGGIFLGLTLLILPGLIVASTYLLGPCYVIDLGESISDSFDASKRMTKKYRKQIFDYTTFFVLITIISGFILLTLMGASGNEHIISFTFGFELSVISMMYQRFISLIYIDLEYGDEINLAKK